MKLKFFNTTPMLIQDFGILLNKNSFGLIAGSFPPGYKVFPQSENQLLLPIYFSGDTKTSPNLHGNDYFYS
jgi:hypothetical protein